MCIVIILYPSMMGGHLKSTGPHSLVCFPINFLDVGKVGYDGDGVVESAWTTTAYSYDVWFREHTWQG